MRPRHAVFCSFENRFAKSGGLAAVAVNTLPFLKEMSRLETVSLITPFYPFLMDEGRLEHSDIRFRVSFGGGFVNAELLRNTCSYTAPRAGSLPEYYLKAEGYFAATNRLRDPYLYVEEDSTENEKRLRQNALFFCAAVPYALSALGLTDDVILHLQEWQTALVSFTVKAAMISGVLGSCATVQTMHNPYDCYMPTHDLQQIADSTFMRDRMPAVIGNGMTAYQVGLGLVDAPVATVSRTFARELTSDIMQTEHFAPHLQPLFHRGVTGINNGPFVSFSDRFPKRAAHSIQEISDIKSDARSALLKILAEDLPPQCFGSLTYKRKRITDLAGNVPIVVMSGRLDPGQKGYDILLQALQRFAPDEIKVVLTPLATRESDLDYFRETAKVCEGNLIVIPVRMAKGYVELQTGSTFGIMPSIYEPFGAAIEYMANGTVNIARRTGGLVDQIVDGKTGFLFREADDNYTLENIKNFAENSRNVQLRKSNKWAADMAASLEATLKMATKIFSHNPDNYYQMILKGFEKAAEFKWEKNAAEYWRLYQNAAGTDPVI